MFCFIFGLFDYKSILPFPRYIDNVFKKLSHLQTLSEKVIEKSVNLETKRSNLLTELSVVGPQTAILIQQTKSLQQRVSDCLCFTNGLV